MVKKLIYIPMLALVLGCATGCEHTAPVADILNAGASIPAGTLPMNPLAWRMVTSFANRTDGTMATLYGNDDAIAAARADSSYNAKAVLALVTWSTKEDPHWFGGSIPAKPTRVEFAQAQATGANNVSWSYSRYEGSPLKKVDVAPDAAAQRAASLASQKAAVMP
jgi:hypothetical protein